MTIIPTRHVARKDHRCDDRAAPWCPGWIRKGDAYIRHALPPWTEPNEGPDWWVIRSCQTCEEWRIDAIADNPLRQPGQVMP